MTTDTANLNTVYPGQRSILAELDIDTSGNARTANPTTSHEAARTSAVNTGAQCGRLLSALSLRNGRLSAWQANAILGERLDSQVGGKRLPDLVRRGWALRLDETTISPATGKAQSIYAITNDGLAIAPRWNDHRTPSTIIDAALAGTPKTDGYPCHWPGCGFVGATTAGWCQHQRRSHGGTKTLPDGPITGGAS